MTQERLTNMAEKLNAAYSGLTGSEILVKKLELASAEEQVTGAVIDIMAAEDKLEYEQPYLEGLSLMLGQPEFAQKDKMLSIMELMEAKDWLGSALAQRSGEVGVQVVIGEENRDETLHDLSLIFSSYGIPGQIDGTIGVIGPTRMDYRRAISTVDYMSEVLSGLVAGVCRGD